ncbi:MAG: DUF445 family protein [Deltaproteobacteria bacterium]|nr:DUF445 family protein [Deltaproteobacteria bacterium]
MTATAILLVSVPVICGVIGWLTNVVAIKMIFRPREPLKVLGLRLRGVLPKYLPHFARQLAEIITGDFISTSEMLERLDLDALLEKLRPRLDATFDTLWAEVLLELGAGQRAMLDEEVREAARQKLYEELRSALPEFRREMVVRADGMIDLCGNVERKIMHFGPGRLEEIIYDIAGRELRFIEIYGGVFGVVIGLLQVGVLTLAPLYWELPVAGMVVGAITNYLALQMLFYPRDPCKVGPLTLQGLFPKRQTEIARAQAEVAARDLILAEEIFSQLKAELLPQQAESAMLERAEALVRERYPSVAAVADALLNSTQRERLRELLATRLLELSPEIAHTIISVSAKQLDLAAIMADKIASLPRLRFEQLLRGLFKQEELYLVFYGALLGGTMGLVQLAGLALVHS